MLTKRTLTIAFVWAFLGGLSGPLQAQDADTGIATPEGVPPEVAELFGEMEASGADIDIAPSEEPTNLEFGDSGATVGSRYIFTTLRVINNGSPRGCGYGDWNGPGSPTETTTYRDCD